MSWTDERVETLKRMWNEGQSASQIAKELGGVTRNAVIGKVHRLGLSNRVGAAPGAPVPPVSPAAASPRPAPRSARPDETDEDEADDDLDLIGADDPDEGEGEGEESARDEAPPAPTATVVPLMPVRKVIIPAGQPLPPQPSLNEISPEALAKVTEVEKTARRLTLMELTEKTCKWPVGDPATDNFWFCGLPVQQGKPYCEAHVGVAFQPMSARRDRRR
jgi:GcrA cell cycle regulator